MVQKIALLNHNGGVSKAAIAFNLGWMLTLKGKKVILVDADPQCNLTMMALGETGIGETYPIYPDIKTGLAPSFEAQPQAIEAIDCIPLGNRDRLFLLPGHVGFSEYEVTLGIAQELSRSIQALRNLPGSIADLLEKTGHKYDADYMLIDMSPGLGSINQNVLTTSDFFIIPTNADIFSVMAIDSLANVLPKWSAWAKQASSLQVLQDATYPFPETTTRFLGTIIQNYRIRNGKETPAFKTWIDNIEGDVSEKLVPALQRNNMLLPMRNYIQNGMSDCLTLAKIPNFNSLIGLSQESQTPVFALTDEHLRSQNWQGVVLENAIEKKDGFYSAFDAIADKVIGLTSVAYAVSA